MPTPKPMTVMHAFAEYVDRAYPGVELPVPQAQEIRRAFVSGGYFLLTYLRDYLGDDQIDEDRGVDELERIKAECEQFGAHVGAGTDPPRPPRSENVGRLEIGTILGMRTKQGIVELVVDGHKTQMEIAKAREVARMLLEAIEAAVSDTLIFQFLRERVGLDDHQAARALVEFRELRQGSTGTVYPS